MKHLFNVLIFLAVANFSIAQEAPKSIAEKLSGESDSRVQIGGYAQIDFNQPLKENEMSNGTMDVHRLVLLFGYRFNERTNFVTEIEMEHVKEVFVEQAYLNYEIKPWLNFRGGLM